MKREKKCWVKVWFVVCGATTLPFGGQPRSWLCLLQQSSGQKGGEKQESGSTSAQLTNKQEKTTVAARTPCASVRSR